MSSLKISFPPIVPEQPRALILGTLPGEESLRHNEYYAHPRNAFWSIMAAAFDSPHAHSYAEKTELLHRHAVALWDVLESADRKGSLDRDLRNARPNDVTEMLCRCQSIETVFFNGATAHKMFRRHMARDLLKLRPLVELKVLPSSSPALALPLSVKVKVWQAALRPVCE
jgi:hypoxanthine-DNA glycosylase